MSYLSKRNLPLKEKQQRNDSNQYHEEVEFRVAVNWFFSTLRQTFVIVVQFAKILIALDLLHRRLYRPIILLNAEFSHSDAVHLFLSFSRMRYTLIFAFASVIL